MNEAASADETLRLRVTVVMPCLNEERTVGRCVAKALAALRRIGLSGEVLVVDNRSDDGSIAAAEKSGARVVVEPCRGYGAALCRGFLEARGQWIVMGDCDESYDFNDVGRFVERLENGADLVIGNRFSGGVLPGAMPWLHRRVGNPLLSFLVNAMFHAGVGDSQSGMRGLSRATIRTIKARSLGMEFASEMLIKASVAGLRIDEIPIVLAPDGRGRPPHLRSFRDGWRHLRLMLMLSPHYLFLLPGLLLALIGLSIIPLAMFVGDGKFDDVFAPNFMIAASLLSICGSQLGLLGVLAKLSAAALDPIFEDRRLRRLASAVSVERGLAATVALAVAAAMSGLPLLTGDVSVLRMNGSGCWILACTFFVLGVQTLFGSFLIRIVEMHRCGHACAEVGAADDGID